MSEREVRELMNMVIDTYGDWYEMNEDRNELLAKPPDVVVLLRWLTRWRDTYTDKLTGDLYAPPDMAWATIEATINEIEKTVCLTDDGWEWVD